MQKYCFSSSRTVQQIASFLKLEGKNVITQLHHYFDTKKAKKLFNTEKLDGILWIRTNPLFFSNSSLDLIHYKQNTPKTEKNTERHYQKLEGLKRVCPEKLEVILKLNRINKFGYYDKELKQFIYTNNVKQEIDDLFKAYCSRIKQERIVLSHTPSGSPVFAQDVYLPYKTRFTDYSRQQKNIEGFRAAFKKASRRHMKGVLLTLTSDPKGGSLWNINQNTIAAWKKFQKFLNRALPERSEWLKVNEFMKNGMLHYHILVFGINWLLLKSVIQYAWVKYGGGRILDIHAISNDPLKGWHWSKSCPKDSAGQQPESYLCAYLEKSMTVKHGALYWATGVRNWTCSSSLLPEKLQASKAKPLGSSIKKYFLKGVSSLLTGFRSSKRKDAIELFSGAIKKVTPKAPKAEAPKKETPIKFDLSFKPANTLSYGSKVNQKINSLVNTLNSIKLPPHSIDKAKSNSYLQTEATKQYLRATGVNKEQSSKEPPSKQKLQYSDTFADLLAKYG